MLTVRLTFHGDEFLTIVNEHIKTQHIKIGDGGSRLTGHESETLAWAVGQSKKRYDHVFPLSLARPTRCICCEVNIIYPSGLSFAL